MEEKKVEKERKENLVEKVTENNKSEFDFKNSTISENGVVDLINGNLVVVREKIIGRNGQPMLSAKGNYVYAYVIHCKIRERDMQINISPKASDVGAFELLDLIFTISSKAELIIGEESMTDDNGRTTYYPTYTVHVREGNIDYDCSVRLSRPSDRSLLSTVKSILLDRGIL